MEGVSVMTSSLFVIFMNYFLMYWWIENCGFLTYLVYRTMVIGFYPYGKSFDWISNFMLGQDLPRMLVVILQSPFLFVVLWLQKDLGMFYPGI